MRVLLLILPLAIALAGCASPAHQTRASHKARESSHVQSRALATTEPVMPEGDLASLAFLRGCWRHAERLHTLGELRHSKHCTIGVLPKVPRGALFVYGDVQYDLAWRRAGEAWLGTLRSRSSDPFAEPSDPFAELSITAGKQGLLLRARRESSWLGISKSVPLVGRTAQDSVYFGEALSMRSTTLDGAPVLLVRMAGGLRVFERMPCAR